eukprot:gene7368-5184_t
MFPYYILHLLFLCNSVVTCGVGSIRLFRLHISISVWNDLDAETHKRKPAKFGNTTLAVAVSSALRKIKKNMSFERNIDKMQPLFLPPVVDSLRQFKYVWQMLCHPTFLFTNQHEKLFTEATQMWNSYFTPSRWMEPLFRSPRGLDDSDECVASLVFCVLHLLQAPPSRELLFEKCITGGCAAIITTVKATVGYRAQLMGEMRVFTPPVQTAAFLLRADHYTIPLRENKWVIKNEACQKLSDAIRRAKRGFAHLYGQIVSEELLSASLLLRRGDPMVTQHLPYPLGVRPAFWSFWQIACGIYQAATKTHNHFAVMSGKLLLASVASQFTVQLREWSEECSMEQKLLHSREVVVFVFFIRLWRDYMGPDLYNTMVLKPLFKLIAASAIDKLPLKREELEKDGDELKRDQIRKAKEDAQNANTAKFFAAIWAVPALSPAELSVMIDQGSVPWDPQFPRSFSIEAITCGTPLYITRHVRHSLRQITLLPGEKPEKADKEEKPEKADKEEKPEKADKEEKPEKADKEEKPEKADKEEKPKKPVKRGTSRGKKKEKAQTPEVDAQAMPAAMSQTPEKVDESPEAVNTTEVKKRGKKGKKGKKAKQEEEEVTCCNSSLDKSSLETTNSWECGRDIPQKIRQQQKNQPFHYYGKVTEHLFYFKRGLTLCSRPPLGVVTCHTRFSDVQTVVAVGHILFLLIYFSPQQSVLKMFFRKVSIHDCPLALRQGVSQLVHTTLLLEGLAADVELDVFFVSMSSMRQIHYYCKGCDAPTDALTFRESNTSSSLVNALLFSRVPGVPSQDLFYRDASLTHPTSKNEALWRRAQAVESSRSSVQCLGEIYLCPTYIQARRIRFPHKNLPFPLYLHAAIVHAVLHAVGYDHETKEQLKEMVQREQQLGLRLRQLRRRYPHLLEPLPEEQEMNLEVKTNRKIGRNGETVSATSGVRGANGIKVFYGIFNFFSFRFLFFVCVFPPILRLVCSVEWLLPCCVFFDFSLDDEVSIYLNNRKTNRQTNKSMETHHVLYEASALHMLLLILG